MSFSVTSEVAASGTGIDPPAAALLVGSRTDPYAVKTFEGTARWQKRYQGSDPAAQELIADISIPSAKLEVEITFRKSDRSTPESVLEAHVRFHQLPGNTLGTVARIRLLQMRDETGQRGTDLAGIVSATSPDDFDMDINLGSAGNTDRRMIIFREWFDMPMLLSSGLVCKVTFQKGAVGQDLVEEAFKTWRLLE